MLQSTEVAAKYHLLAERDYEFHKASPIGGNIRLHIVLKICIIFCLFFLTLLAYMWTLCT